jgi:hypothetical protein
MTAKMQGLGDKISLFLVIDLDSISRVEGASIFIFL